MQSSLQVASIFFGLNEVFGNALMLPFNWDLQHVLLESSIIKDPEVKPKPLTNEKPTGKSE